VQIPYSSSFQNRAVELRESFGLQGVAEPQKSNNESQFLNMLGQGVGHVSQMQTDANDQVTAMLSGEDVSQAEVFTSIQKADMSFSLLVQIRNKLLQAYEEINAIRI
jgi:flagellar hook-basal body complex protein FliE